MNDYKVGKDEVYKILQKRIIELEYQPGDILNETELAEEFKLSRTPIRRAFQDLKNDNLLNIIPRFGAQVSAVDFKEMKCIFDVTRVLDPYATSLAIDNIGIEDRERLRSIVKELKEYNIERDYKKVVKADDLFHRIILENTENNCLEEMLTRLHIHTSRFWNYCQDQVDSIDLFTDSLEDIVLSIENKDKKAAMDYSTKHIDVFLDKIQRDLF